MAARGMCSVVLLVVLVSVLDRCPAAADPRMRVVYSRPPPPLAMSSQYVASPSGQESNGNMYWAAPGKEAMSMKAPSNWFLPKVGYRPEMLKKADDGFSADVDDRAMTADVSEKKGYPGTVRVRPGDMVLPKDFPKFKSRGEKAYNFFLMKG